MRGPATRGFTLIEVLVALLVMAIMAGMAWRGIDVLVRSRDSAETRLAQTARLHTVLAQWEADLRAVQDSHSLVEPVAFDGIAGWQLYCFWGNAWSNCQSTGNAAQAGPVNPRARQQPPAGLRIALQMAEGSGLAGTLTRQLEVTVR